MTLDMCKYVNIFLKKNVMLIIVIRRSIIQLFISTIIMELLSMMVVCRYKLADFRFSQFRYS